MVTEEEHLGVHAFLEAYHNEQHNKSAYLKYGSLPGRAGSLQAAINLEIADLNIGKQVEKASLSHHLLTV